MNGESLMDGAVVIVGGTAGLGLGIARHYHDSGGAVIVTGRDETRAQAASKTLGAGASFLGLRSAEPGSIAAACADVGPVSRLVLAAIARPGSTTVTTVNGGISSLIRTLAIELAPIRFNAIHPGIVGDSPYWSNKPLGAVLARTPTGRLTTMADVVDASVFLLENRAINGVNLYVDGGWMLM